MKKSFDDKKGEKYNLIETTDPFFKIMQQKVGSILKNKFKTSKNKIINVLEIGCGTGYTTELILKADKRFRVVGVDNEKLMIKQAKKFLSKQVKHNRLILLQKDALKFLKSCESNKFDCFVSAFTLHNFNKQYRKEILIEIYRVLKHKGIFINLDKYSLDNPLAREKALNYQMSCFRKILPKELSELWIKHYLHDEKNQFLMGEKDSISLMSSLGFKNSKIIARKYMKAILFAKK